MKQNRNQLTSGYLALMLGLGINPIGTHANETRFLERPCASVIAHVRHNPAHLAARWQSNGHVKWTVNH